MKCQYSSVGVTSGGAASCNALNAICRCLGNASLLALRLLGSSTKSCVLVTFPVRGKEDSYCLSDGGFAIYIRNLQH